MIQIMSRKSAAEAVRVSPDRPIIAIGETYNDDVNEMVVRYSNNCLCLKFEDIECERPGYETVKEEQVRIALEWAKDKNDLIVACRAGISRSAAVAYLIMCSRTSPQEAAKVLDANRHQPNRLVVRMGAKVLGDKRVEDTIEEWMGKIHQRDTY